MRIIYTLPALADLEHVLNELPPQGLRSVRTRIDEIEKLLEQFPDSGSPTSFKWLRRISTSPHPYVIFYEPAAHAIIIHAIRHGARDPAAMPDAG